MGEATRTKNIHTIKHKQRKAYIAKPICVAQKELDANGHALFLNFKALLQLYSS
jgi:hypothetical protein